MSQIENRQELPNASRQSRESMDVAVAVEKDRVRLSLFEQLYNRPFVRKTFIVVLLITLWQVYALWLDNALMFPTFTATLDGWFNILLNGELANCVAGSLKTQLIGYFIGILLAASLAIFAITTRFGADLLELLSSMLNPLPPIALLPLALLWFGFGYTGIVFVIVHSVAWPMAIAIYNGFTGVSATLRMVGHSYELNGLAFIFRILVPAAFPSVLTGLKIGWAFSWRTLIASELIFGVTSGSSGLGWFIYEKKNQLDIDLVFAGLLTIILIGVAVESLLFKIIEKHTVTKWGMRIQS